MDDDEHGGGTGHGLGRKIGPFPLGVWAVILGAGGGLVWMLKNRLSSSSAAADTTGTGSTSDTAAPTTITPINEGLGEQQYKDLLKAIKDRDGKPSEPTGGSTPPPPNPPGPPAPKPPAPKPTKPKPTAPKPKPKPKKLPTKPSSHWVTVKAGSGASFSSIAAQYGHSWRDLWNYQLEPGVRPAATQATLKKRGPNNSLFGMSTVAIPASWKKKK